MKLAVLSLLAAACSSVQQSVPAIAPRPETVVIVVHDSSPASRSKYLSDIRPEGRIKFNPSLPWMSEFKAPAIYADWWQEIGKCEKLSMPTELTKRVKFVFVNSETFRIPGYSGLLGLTDPESLTIILAQSKVNDKSVVMHEMAHQGAVWNGIDEGKDFHPYTIFEECNLHVTYP